MKTLLAAGMLAAALSAADAASASTRWECVVVAHVWGGGKQVTFTAKADKELTAENTASGACVHRPLDKPRMDIRSCYNRTCHKI